MSDDPKTVDAEAHQRLADAHERLKADAKADRDALKKLQDDLAVLTTAKEEAEAEAARKAGDVDSVKAQLEAKHAREIKAVTDRAEKAEGQVRKLVIDNGLSDALDGVKVSPALKKAATALLREGVELKDNNGEPVALLGGAPLTDAIKTWAASDEGKHFVMNGSSGGDAPGGRIGDPGSNPWKQGAGFSLTQQDAITAKDPAQASRLKAEAGVA